MRPPKGFSFVFAFLLFIIPLTASAQLDPSFGVGGRMDQTLQGTQVAVEPILLPDGKILVLTLNASIGPVLGY